MPFAIVMKDIEGLCNNAQGWVVVGEGDVLPPPLLCITAYLILY